MHSRKWKFYDSPVINTVYLLQIVFPGTGKSSIVCAMCLGLAGPAKLLGRATEVRLNCSTINFKACSTRILSNI